MNRWLVCSLAALSTVPAGCTPAHAPAPTPERAKAFIGMRLFDGTGAPVLEDAVILVRDGRVEAAGPRGSLSVPEGAETLDLSGKTVVPGLINAHGHVSDVLGLETGHYDRENLLRQLRLYAHYGVTTVNSLGGDGEEAFALRREEDASLNRARIFVAGEIVTGNTVEEVQAKVDENEERGVDFIKIRVDDHLGPGEKMSPELYRAVIERAHEKGRKVATHLFYLDDAKGLLEAGADFVAHSVRDLPVDRMLIDLLKEKGVCYCPTLTREVSTYVYEDVPEFFEDPFFLDQADPEVLEQLKDPERMKSVRESPATQANKKALEVAMSNLKAVADGGVTIAFGTDTGPPARFQGYFEHMELGMMAEAGLSPQQVLMSATGDAADCLGFDELGKLVPGRWADFLVLNADPLASIANLRQLDSVWVAGNRVP